MTAKTVTTTTTARTSKRVAVTLKPTRKGFHYLVDGALPTAGPRLMAHTHAALEFLGLLTGKSALRSAAERLMGHTAITYHVTARNMEARAETVKLTAKGLKSFKARVDTGRVDLDLAAAFLAAISKGRPSVAYSIQADHLMVERDIQIQ